MAFLAGIRTIFGSGLAPFLGRGRAARLGLTIAAQRAAGGFIGSLAGGDDETYIAGDSPDFIEGCTLDDNAFITDGDNEVALIQSDCEAAALSALESNVPVRTGRMQAECFSENIGQVSVVSSSVPYAVYVEGYYDALGEAQNAAISTIRDFTIYAHYDCGLAGVVEIPYHFSGSSFIKVGITGTQLFIEREEFSL